MSENKNLVVVLSDPTNGGDEAQGRLLNAIVAVYDLKQRGAEVSMVFQGAGTRWLPLISKADHPLNNYYAAVEDRVIGASRGCSDIFGATEGMEATDKPLICDLELPGTKGVTPLGKFIQEDYKVVTF